MKQLLKTVALELIDEPAHPVRERFDDDELDELRDSILALGLIQPIVCEAVNGRFRVIAGHRRLLACRRAQLLKVPIVVRDDADERRDAVMVQENIARTDLTPAEEARRIQQIYLACGEDLEKAADVLKLSVGYCEHRLALLTGDELVLSALDRGEISIGVAEELNKIAREDLRRTHLHDAVQTGVNVRQAREWRLKANAFADIQTMAVDRGAMPPEAAVVTPAPITHSLDCEFCQSGEDLHLLRMYHLHPHCWRAIAAMMRRARGEA